MSQLEELIFKYFDDGLWYKENLEFIELVHGYSLSLSSLKKILRRNNKKKEHKMFTTRTFWCSWKGTCW